MRSFNQCEHSVCLPCDVGISTTSSIFKLVVSLLRSVIKLVSLCGIGETQKRGIALLGRGLLSQPMRGQLLLLRTNSNPALCGAIWQLKWNFSCLMCTILTDFRAIRSRKTSQDGLVINFCLLFVCWWNMSSVLRQIESPNQTLTG